MLLREKKICGIPDWKKALRPDLMEKARAGVVRFHNRAASWPRSSRRKPTS